MIFDKISTLNDNFYNFPGIESNDEDSPILSQINDAFYYSSPSLSLDEDENEIEKLLFIDKENSERNNNNSRHIFTIEIAKKKRGLKRNKESKKAEHNIWSNDNIISKIQIFLINIKILIKI